MPFIIRAAHGLSKPEFTEICQLEEICNANEHLNMKLNWDMLEDRPVAEANDYLCYEDGRLIGFLGLYDFGPKPTKVEIIGMVHPAYRRQGVFSRLYAAAKEECLRRGMDLILLIAERSAKGGQGFVKSVAASYDFSEYRLRFKGITIPTCAGEVILRPAQQEDFPTIFKLDSICFDIDLEEVANRFSPESYASCLVGEVAGQVVGKIRITREGNEAGIYGFGVLPQFRRRGYGREILSKTMRKLVEAGLTQIFLEVATDNTKALALYESCGFQQATVYDYFAVPLKELRARPGSV